MTNHILPQSGPESKPSKFTTPEQIYHGTCPICGGFLTVLPVNGIPRVACWDTGNFHDLGIISVELSDAYEAYCLDVAFANVNWSNRLESELDERWQR